MYGINFTSLSSTLHNTMLRRKREREGERTRESEREVAERLRQRERQRERERERQSERQRDRERGLPAGAGQYWALLKSNIESEAFTTPLQLCGVVLHSHEGDPSSLHFYCEQIG